MDRTKVYHQCGFREKWNMDIFLSEGVGDGLILSPVNLKLSKMVALQDEIKNNSIFDPQFYKPNSDKALLAEYDFFPDKLMEGYETEAFDNFANECANRCTDFQIANGFKYITIPTICFEEYRADYLEVLRNSFTYPFLDNLKEKEFSQKVILTIILHSNQIKPGTIRDELLNYLTESTSIDGIYIIPYTKKTSKRLKDIEFIYNMMTFIDVLRNNDLEVHVGYTDIVGLLYTLADTTSISMGSYENLRNFSLKRFMITESGGQGPSPRIYSALLLQWINYNYLLPLNIAAGEKKYFDENKHSIEMFKPDFKWHFTKPALYKHYFVSYYNQINSLQNTFEERYNQIVNIIESAINEFNHIRECGIFLGNDDDGSHLPMWLTVLNMFYKYKKGI